MGLWGKFVEWLKDDGPPRVPMVGAFTDDRLAELWRERQQLTDVAREAVRAECVRRGLKLRGLLPEAEQPKKKPEDPSRPRATGNVLELPPGLGVVLLQTIPGRFALIILPRWSPAPVELPTDKPLDAIIVCNHEKRGWLDTARWSAEKIFATAEGAIDRSPGVQSGSATLLPAELELGSLTLTRVIGALHALWHGADATAVIGPTLPASLVQLRPAPKIYVGSLPEADGPLGWSALLTAAHASAMMGAIGQRGFGGASSVLISGDAVGTPLLAHTHLMSGFGIQVVGAECPVAPESIELLGHVLTGRFDFAASPALVEDVFEHLLIEGRTDDARRLVDAALARTPDDPLVSRLHAQLLASSGDLDGALAALNRAKPDAYGPLVISAIHLAREDWTAAEGAVRQAVAVAPADVDVISSLVRCLWMSGRGDEARKVLDEAPAFSLSGTQASDLYLVVDQPRPTESLRRAVFPHVSARAMRLARATRGPDEVKRALERVLALDPHCAAALQAPA